METTGKASTLRSQPTHPPTHPPSRQKQQLLQHPLKPCHGDSGSCSGLGLGLLRTWFVLGFGFGLSRTNFGLRVWCFRFRLRVGLGLWMGGWALSAG